MRVPLLWVSDYVDLPVGAEAIAERLTMAGIEVERIESVGSHWGSAVRVGQVISIDPHPNADRLLLVTVDFGEGRLQVVTGAANFGVGDRVPLAQVGAMLYNAYKDDRPLEELRPAKLRGVESRGIFGAVFSRKQLRLLRLKVFEARARKLDLRREVGDD